MPLATQSLEFRGNPRHALLDYVSEYKLGESSGERRRNESLLLPKNAHSLIEREECFLTSFLAWRYARRLEGRDDADESEGIWPINHFRCERRIGNPGEDIFPTQTALSRATTEVFESALAYRLLCYHRVANAEEAKAVCQASRPGLRYSTELTTDWYDPADGKITVANSNPEIRGTHGIPLEGLEYSTGKPRFYFRNSWGGYWGERGWGSIAIEHFDRFLVECWDPAPSGFFVPYKATEGIVCLEWKWSVDDNIGIHVREIFDAKSTQRLAWAFCQRRGDYLDVEEFFVWPDERGHGYAHHLARMVHRLADEMRLTLRLLVSYADTEPYNRSNLDAAARLLKVELAESGENWVHLFGTANAVQRPPLRERRPARPANPLEDLRPSDEQPIDSPTEYVVFFGTNRKKFKVTDNTSNFGPERDTQLHLGKATATIPVTPRFGSNGRWWKLIWDEFLGRAPKLNKRELFPDEEVLGWLLDPIMYVWGERAHNLLYVHGFNTAFDDAMIQAARLGVDLKVPGQTFCYSWPSAAQLTRYVADEAAVEASLPFLEQYIGMILRQTKDVPLSIIVHSMGNRAVIRCLESMARNADSPFKGRIRQLIMAAPDVDFDVFKQSVPNLLSVPTRTTLYASRGDVPLRTAGWLHKYDRAGLAPPVMTLPGMDTVLVEGFNLLNLAHSYYAEASFVLHDMFVLFHMDSEPDSRPATISTKTLAGEKYWKLPAC